MVKDKRYKKYKGEYVIQGAPRKILITLAVALSGVLAATGAYGGYKYIGDNNYYKDVQNLMLQTQDGKCITAPIDKGQPIGVVINDFNDAERATIINAVKDLDKLSETIDYVFLDEDDPSLSQKVYIRNSDKLFCDDALGCTFLMYSDEEAQIYYPVSVTIKTDLYNQSTLGGENMLSQVVKHEMMHTLGFKDLYEFTQINETIMYGYAGPQILHGYSKRDEKAIQTIYDDVVDVELPESTHYELSYSGIDLINDKNSAYTPSSGPSME